MAFISPTALNTWRRFCAIRDAKFYSGVDDFNDNDDSNNQRNVKHKGIWRRLLERQCEQSDSQRLCRRFRHNIYSDGHHQAIQPRGGNKSCRRSGRNRHHKDDYNKLSYKQLVRVLAIVFCLCLPAKAEGGSTTAIANPVATSSGSVSNQAVQINQGGYSQQGFGNGHACNSSTLVFTPFYMSNDVNNHDPAASYIRNQNFGAQISFSVPLDTQMVRLCKELAKRKIEKERLDYELVRILKCVEIKKAGYTIHPSSPYAGVCADVIPIAAVQK